MGVKTMLLSVSLRRTLGYRLAAVSGRLIALSFSETLLYGRSKQECASEAKGVFASLLENYSKKDDECLNDVRFVAASDSLGAALHASSPHCVFGKLYCHFGVTAPKLHLWRPFPKSFTEPFCHWKRND